MKPIYFYPPEEIAYRALVESHFESIQQELLDLLDIKDRQTIPSISNWTGAYSDYVNSQHSISWKTYELLFFGIKHQENIKKCPKTYEVIRQIPEIITAQFSFLSPQTHIQPHKGYSKMILRNHLPLLVPEGNQCGIRIEDETHYWNEGKLVSFDDNFEHEAWNHSDQIRIVLMFDVAKPDGQYSAQEICRYKLENLQDESLLKIAPKERWLEWLNKGEFF